MPKLVDLNITEISGVDKAANGRRFLVVKRAERAFEPEEVVTKALTDEDKSAYKSDLRDGSTQDLVAGHRRIHQWAGSGALPTGLSKTDLVWMHNALVDELRRRFKEENPDTTYEHDSPLRVEDIPDGPGDVEKCRAITNLTSRVKRREEGKVKKGGAFMSDEQHDTTPVRREESRAQTLWRFVKGLFGQPDRVEKSEKAKTLNEIMAERQKTEVLWDLINALQESIWSILEDDTITDKASAVVETVSQFQAQVLSSGILKRGAKISADRLARLKQAHDLLGQIIGEAEAKDDEAVTKAGPASTETAVSAQPPDLEATVQKALEPLLERLAVLEQAPAAAEIRASAAGNGAGVAEAAPMEAAISKALEPIVARIEALEKARGIKKSIDGQDGSTKESLWAGIL